MNTQVVFIINGEIQRIIVHEPNNQIQTILELSKRYHSSLIVIFESIIGAALNYTQRSRVSLILRELVGHETQNAGCAHT